MTRKQSGCLIALGVAAGIVVFLVIAGAIALFFFLRSQESRDATPLPDVELPVGSTAMPVDRMYFDSDRTGNFELFTMGHDGSDPVQVTDDPKFDSWWPRISPDRTRILFYRAPAGKHDTDFTQTSLWMANADGTEIVEVLPVASHGWWQQGHAEWSPDGEQLVMFGGSKISPQVFVTDNLGRDPENITSRGGSNIDPSWSPDGRTIYFIGCPGNFCTTGDYEVYAIPTNGNGDATRLTKNDQRDQDPYMSPDGQQLGWLFESSGGSKPSWNINVADRAAKDPTAVPDDDNITSLPRWSSDGALIYSHQLDYASADPRFQSIVMNADGTNLRTLTAGQPGRNEYPSP